jgi:hypothetical protein
MEIVADSKRDYHDLTEDEKRQLVESLENHRESVAKGRRVSAKSHAQDVRHTLHRVGIEVSNTQSQLCLC